MGLIEATLEATRLRFRLIMMTSLAFAFGAMPPALASGTASASRRTIGTGVPGGIIVAAVLTAFLVLMFFVAVRHVFRGDEWQHRLDVAHGHETARPAI